LPGTPTTVYIGLGTNLGDRAANLHQAVQRLASCTTVLAASPIYETEPWGYADQPAFLNQVVQSETSLTPLRLLNCLKKLEVEIGRTPTFRYGHRVIDLDILFFGDRILQTGRLMIPHPRLQERAFVLVPLNDLAPQWIHPVLGKTVQQILADVDTSGIHPYRLA